MVGFYYIYGWLLHLSLVQQVSWELSLNWFAIYPQRCIWTNEYLAIMYRWNRSFNSPPPPGAYPRHLTPLPSRGGGNLIIGVFQGVGNLIPMRWGWGIWTAPSISCEISGVASCHGGRGVRGFSWKRLCLCGQLVTRFVPYLKWIKF